MACSELPTNPSGWFHVADVADLKPGSVRPLRYFGRDLVLTRYAKSEIALFDAHCPHLGAHLGHGGRVVGDTIECPFHGWRFGVKGHCTSIPYSDVVPERSGLKRWETQEANGSVLAFFSRDGSLPAWQVGESTEFHDSAYVLKRLSWTVRTHPQEIVENIVDPRHFAKLHNIQVASGEWESNGPILRTRLVTNPIASRPDVEDVLQVTDYGLGVEVVRSGIGDVRVVVMNTRTPIEDGVLACHATFAIKRQANDAATTQAVQMFVDSYEQEFRRDMVVWENKKYLDRPSLSSEDGPIGLFRAWCKQFYSDSEEAVVAQLRTRRASWRDRATLLSAGSPRRAATDLQSNEVS